MNIKNELKFALMRSAILSEAASFDAKGRKKIIVAFLLLLLGIAAPQYGKVIGTLPVDYLKLPILRMDSHQVYVVDKLEKKGYIFDRKTLKKVAEFGRPGEGPFEFKGISGFHIDEQYLYVSASLKMSIFAKNGRPVKEIKEDTFIYDIIPCGKYFIGRKKLPAKRGSDEVTIQFNLYDSNM